MSHFVSGLRANVMQADVVAVATVPAVLAVTSHLEPHPGLPPFLHAALIEFFIKDDVGGLKLGPCLTVIPPPATEPTSQAAVEVVVEEGG